MKNKFIIVLFGILFSTQSLAKIGKLTEDITLLAGAFSGETKNNGKQTVKVLIAPRKEKPGTYLVTLIIREEQGLLMEGEWIAGTRTIGLSLLALNRESSELEIKTPPVALMRLINHGEEVDRIEIISQLNQRELSVDLAFDDIVLRNKIHEMHIGSVFQGEYSDAGFFTSEKNRISIGSDYLVDADLSTKYRDFKGQYRIALDREQLSVLRSIYFDENYQTHESEKILAWILNIVDGDRSTLWILVPNSYKNFSQLIILKKK